MFRGLHEHTMDAKGRTSFPSRFRDVLRAQQSPAAAQAEPPSSAAGEADASEERLIITTGIDRCLVAYPPAEWEAFEQRLAGLSQFDPAVVQLRRIYVAGAHECSLDKHGRLLIPPMLREYAQLERDVVWAGMVTTIEVWAKGLWMEQMAASRQDRQGIAKALTELGL